MGTNTKALDHTGYEQRSSLNWSRFIIQSNGDYYCDLHGITDPMGYIIDVWNSIWMISHREEEMLTLFRYKVSKLFDSCTQLTCNYSKSLHLICL